MDSVFQTVGLVGVVFYLAAYALLQFGVIKGNRLPYTLMNLTAASLVLVSLTEDFNLSSAIIQVSWITLSIVGMIRVWLASRALRFNAEESSFAKSRFATMRPADVKRLFLAGYWKDGGKGEILTREGTPVERLIYLCSGRADVLVDDQVIAQIEPGSFVGEMGCMSHAPASATVRLADNARYFAITSDGLQALIRRNPELGAHVEYAFAASTKEKLVATNVLLRRALDGEYQVEKQVRALSGAHA